MARVKRGVVSRKKHNKLLKSVRGYRMTKSTLVKVAHEAHLHAGQHAFIGRKNKKRDMRSLWISRISGSLKPMDMSYSRFMHALKIKNIMINRKMLSELITNDPDAFGQIVKQAKA